MHIETFVDKNHTREQFYMIMKLYFAQYALLDFKDSAGLAFLSFQVKLWNLRGYCCIIDNGTLYLLPDLSIYL